MKGMTMAILKYIPEKHYNNLEDKILENLSYYEGEDNTLHPLYEDLNSTCLDSGINIEFPELINDQKADAENAKKIYEAFKNLSIINATDRRLWAYLTHLKYYDYVKKRWKINEKEQDDTETSKQQRRGQG
jgi:hypothetical protein